MTPGSSAHAVRIQVLGPLRVWRGGGEVDAGPPQQRCLLALLAARAGHPILQPDLIRMLWGDDPPASAVNVIHKYVGALRRILEPGLAARTQGGWLIRHGSGYRLAVDAERLDLAAFRRDVEAARASLRQDRPGDALDHYLEGLGRWQGPPGDGLADTVAATAVFAGPQGELFEATVEAAELAVRAGQPQRVVAALRRAAGLGRFDEPLHALLIRTLAAAGRQAEALEVFAAIRDRLTGELGIDPGAGLRQAFHDVLAHSAAEGEPAGAEPIPLVRPAQLPPDLPTFVGRQVELAALHRLADRHSGGAGPLIVAIDGMGGVGKSTLALHFGHRIAGRLPDGQLYLDLHGYEPHAVRPPEALRSLLFALGVPAALLPDDVDALAGMYRSLTAARSMLVLLDNAADAGQVRPLLPGSASSVVLVTGRAPMAGLAAHEGAHLLHVDVPDEPAARAMLARRLPGAATEGDTAPLRTIVARCGRLPLALALVAARINARPRLTPAEAAAELSDDGGLPHALRGGPGVNDPRTVFAWSYRRLTPGAARLFRLSSVILCPDVSVAAAASLAGLDHGTARRLLDELAEVALTDQPGDGRFRSHILVKAYARELCTRIDGDRERDRATVRLLQHYLFSSLHGRQPPAEPPPMLPGVRPEEPEDPAAWFSTEREVLIDAVHRSAAAGIGFPPWHLALALQQQLRRGGFLSQWIEVTGAALTAARRTGDRLGQAHMLRSQAAARSCFGSYQLARDLLAEAGQIYTDLGHVLDRAHTHADLGDVLDRAGHPTEALDEHRRALAAYTAAGDPRGQARAHAAIGNTLAALGDLTEATASIERALAGDDDASEETRLRIDLARVLVLRGRLADGVAQLAAAERVARRLGSGPLQFEVWLHLARALLAVGEADRARAAWASARSMLLTLDNGGPADLRTRLAEVRHAVEASRAS